MQGESWTVYTPTLVKGKAFIESFSEGGFKILKSLYYNF